MDTSTSAGGRAPLSPNRATRDGRGGLRHGRIVKLRGTYGFVHEPATELDYFFAPPTLAKGVVFEQLALGQGVVFIGVEGERGPRAVGLRPAR